jgi:hypothetical protein
LVSAGPGNRVWRVLHRRVNCFTRGCNPVRM